MADALPPHEPLRGEVIRDDGATWMRLEDAAGAIWDEPIAGWVEVWDLTCATPRHYRHDPTGRLASPS